MSIFKTKCIYNGKTVKLTWIPGDNHRGFIPVKQSYGFCFDKNGKLLVQQRKPGPWQVMGGTIETGETPEETLIRELDEEVNVEVTDVVYLGAQKVEEENTEPYYQLRYAARISRLKKRMPDPACCAIRKRKFIDPEDYDKFSNWGKLGDIIVEEAKKKLKIK